VWKLAAATDPGWVPRAREQLDEILLDQAHCEKKAAGVPVSLIFQAPQHPELMAPLARLAREELSHFERVLQQLERRHIAFRRQRPSPYAGRMRQLVRPGQPDRLVDTLLCSALIEARSCERLGLLATSLPDAELAAFYRELQACEARHQHLYVELAQRVADPQTVRERLAWWTSREAAVLAGVAASPPRLHSGAVSWAHSAASPASSRRRSA